MNYTKKIYDKFSKEYHQKIRDPSRNFWNRFIEMPAMGSLLKNIVKNKKVLDLGCGSGIFTKKLASWDAKVVGLDVSKSQIEIAQKENADIKFYIGDARKTPFKNGQFDIVSSSLMAHYIKDIKPLFKEVFRILKNKGIFIFSTHHPVIAKKVKTDNRTEFILTPYFNDDKYTWEMLKGMKMISYHHIFECMINSLNDAGFVIERLLEPKPSKKSKEYDKKNYERTIKYPSFCVIKARKILNY